ncbi:MAG: hypothetical protein LBO63_00990 [Oscillospiraceae bacterium]|nr:hypothetical protein [Oscillospiraceae bacterium]
MNNQNKKPIPRQTDPDDYLDNLLNEYSSPNNTRGTAPRTSGGAVLPRPSAPAQPGAHSASAPADSAPSARRLENSVRPSEAGGLRPPQSARPSDDRTGKAPVPVQKLAEDDELDRSSLLTAVTEQIEELGGVKTSIITDIISTFDEEEFEAAERHATPEDREYVNRVLADMRQKKKRPRVPGYDGSFQGHGSNALSDRNSAEKAAHTSANTGRFSAARGDAPGVPVEEAELFDENTGADRSLEEPIITAELDTAEMPAEAYTAPEKTAEPPAADTSDDNNLIDIMSVVKADANSDGDSPAAVLQQPSLFGEDKKSAAWPVKPSSGTDFSFVNNSAAAQTPAESEVPSLEDPSFLPLVSGRIEQTVEKSREEEFFSDNLDSDDPSSDDISDLSASFGKDSFAVPDFLQKSRELHSKSQRIWHATIVSGALSVILLVVCLALRADMGRLYPKYNYTFGIIISLVLQLLALIVSRDVVTDTFKQLSRGKFSWSSLVLFSNAAGIAYTVYSVSIRPQALPISVINTIALAFCNFGEFKLLQALAKNLRSFVANQNKRVRSLITTQKFKTDRFGRSVSSDPPPIILHTVSGTSSEFYYNLMSEDNGSGLQSALAPFILLFCVAISAFAAILNPSRAFAASSVFAGTLAAFAGFAAPLVYSVAFSFATKTCLDTNLILGGYGAAFTLSKADGLAVTDELLMPLTQSEQQLAQTKSSKSQTGFSLSISKLDFFPSPRWSESRILSYVGSVIIAAGGSAGRKFRSVMQEGGVPILALDSPLDRAGNRNANTDKMHENGLSMTVGGQTVSIGTRAFFQHNKIVNQTDYSGIPVNALIGAINDDIVCQFRISHKILSRVARSLNIIGGIVENFYFSLRDFTVEQNKLPELFGVEPRKITRLTVWDRFRPRDNFTDYDDAQILAVFLESELEIPKISQAVVFLGKLRRLPHVLAVVNLIMGTICALFTVFGMLYTRTPVVRVPELLVLSLFSAAVHFTVYNFYGNMGSHEFHLPFSGK